jgi:hypothetical protein
MSAVAIEPVEGVETTPPSFPPFSTVEEIVPPGQRRVRTRTRRGREAVHVDGADIPHHFAALGVRKSVGLSHMRTDQIPKLSLVHRRAVNVLLSIAQRADRTDPPADGMYSIDLPSLERLCGFQDDSNRKYMIALIRQVVGLHFEFFEGHTIHVGSVIAEIEVCFKTRIMRFSLPNGMRQKLLHPERFSHMKLMLLNMFTSYSALTLYELVSSCFTHPARRTQAYPWQQLSTWLTGSTTPHSTYREFSKLLGRAIDQVNAICPAHTIELMFTKEGRATSDLWFQIHDRAQASLGLEPPHPVLVSQRLSAAVATLSLKASDLQDLVLRHGEDYLIAQAELVVRRIQTSPAGSVAYPRAYYLKAVNENWADVPRESDTADATAAAGSTASADVAPARRRLSLDELRQRWWDEKNAVYRQRLADASIEEREQIRASLDEAMRGLSPTLYEAFKKHGLGRPFTAAAAVNAMARRDWEEPSDEQLIAYGKTLVAEA